jgi:hypothetical protein
MGKEEQVNEYQYGSAPAAGREAANNVGHAAA